MRHYNKSDWVIINYLTTIGFDSINDIYNGYDTVKQKAEDLIEIFSTPLNKIIDTSTSDVKINQSKHIIELMDKLNGDMLKKNIKFAVNIINAGFKIVNVNIKDSNVEYTIIKKYVKENHCEVIMYKKTSELHVPEALNSSAGWVEILKVNKDSVFKFTEECIINQLT